jgi:hypothetical protein
MMIINIFIKNCNEEEKRLFDKFDNKMFF